MVRFRRAFAFVSAALCTAAVLSSAAVHADVMIPPGTPPDIAAIIAKGQNGQPLTMPEIMKLAEWGRISAAKLNTPAGNPTQLPSPHSPAGNADKGIPCMIHYTINYTGHAQDYDETSRVTIVARCMMFPQLGGLDDYFGTSFQPSAHPSSFRFEPLMAGTQIARVGGGTFHQNSTSRSRSGTAESKLDGSYSSAVASFMLVTTGQGGTLYPWSGGAGGVGKGTLTVTDRDGTHTNVSYPENNFLDGLGMFSAEKTIANPAQPGHPCPVPTMRFSYQTLTAAIAAGSPTTISGSEPFQFKMGGIDYAGTDSLSITVNPRPLELLIEPTDTADYKKWLPMPDADDTGSPEFFGHPDPIKMHVVMHDPAQPDAPAANGLRQTNTAVRGRIDIYLHDVSEQAGICMNFPSTSDIKKGLFFPHDQEADIEWIDEQHVRTKSVAAFDATVKVAARDTGAYGKVDAKCEPLGIDSTSALSHTISYVSLPLDDNGNHIADQWEKDHNIWDRNLAADWDDESEPPGLQTKGDGITAYEEYRGFLVDNASHKEEFQRLEQGSRKLFLFLVEKDKDLHSAGAELFKHTTGIDIVYLHSTGRMKPLGSRLYPRWVNFNHTPFTTMQQACVWIDDYNDSQPGFLKGVDSNGDADPHCPVLDDSINLSRNACQNQVESWVRNLPQFGPAGHVPRSFTEAAAATGISLESIGETIQARTPTLVNELIIFCTMHELGHSVGGRHHGLEQYLRANPANDDENYRLQSQFYGGGDPTCPMRYWHFPADQSDVIRFIAGQWDLMSAPGGGDWTFCPEDRLNMRIKP
ncbi:MAG TPA: hypothetical protein VGK19_05840 [Capsulimonadaceae bacterium]